MVRALFLLGRAATHERPIMNDPLFTLLAGAVVGGMIWIPVGICLERLYVWQMQVRDSKRQAAYIAREYLKAVRESTKLAYNGHVTVNHMPTSEVEVHGLYLCRTREQGDALGELLRGLADKDEFPPDYRKPEAKLRVE